MIATLPLPAGTREIQARRIVLALDAEPAGLPPGAGVVADTLRARLVALAESADPGAPGHPRRVGELSRRIAERAGWSPDAAATLGTAAALHDIGKLAIPPFILEHRGVLPPRERAYVALHTRYAERIFAGVVAGDLRLAREVAMRHHERWNGSGYPDGWSGPAIPASARIVAIADVYDAISNDRPYRRALPPDQVRRTLQRGRAVHFDATLVDVLIELLEDGSAPSEPS